MSRFCVSTDMLIILGAPKVQEVFDFLRYNVQGLDCQKPLEVCDM